MIVGLGIDVVELDRVKSAYENFGHRFVSRILTQREVQLLPENPVAYLASRFAVKEAGVKALGTGFSQGITLKHLEVAKDRKGPVQLIFSGPARSRFEFLGGRKIHLSLSHGRDTAVAVVVLER